MKHMMKTCLLILLAIFLSLPAALGDGVVISEREKAIRLADAAMEEKYGITLLLQEYFERSTEEPDGITYDIRYKGMADWAYVLGTYQVTVKNGAVTEITWTHDGDDTSGGLDAEAWGCGQIEEMLRLNQAEGVTDGFDEKAQEINRRKGLSFPRRILSEEEREAEDNRLDAESREARRQAALSVEELTEIGRQAVIEVFQLTDEQAAMMEDLLGTEGTEAWFCMFHEIPCYTSCFGMGTDDEAEMLPNGIRYNEKEGTYWIYINTQTGTVEEIVYSAGIGGNG